MAMVKSGGALTRKYVKVMADVQSTCTLAEIAEVAGVKVRQVSNWVAGSNRPRGAARDRLLALHTVTARLGELFEPEGADIWLHGPNKELGWETPLDALAGGRFKQVSGVLDELEEAVR